MSLLTSRRPSTRPASSRARASTSTPSTASRTRSARRNTPGVICPSWWCTGITTCYDRSSRDRPSYRTRIITYCCSPIAGRWRDTNRPIPPGLPSTLLELASGVWVPECGVLTSREACKAYRICVLTPRILFVHLGAQATSCGPERTPWGPSAHPSSARPGSSQLPQYLRGRAPGVLRACSYI